MPDTRGSSEEASVPGYPHVKDATCPVCRGTGECPEDTDHNRNCVNCDGHGTLRHNLPCGAGSGYALVHLREAVLCSLPDGHGRFQFPGDSIVYDHARPETGDGWQADG
jgi:DnaJ-class molecular chaperone